MTAEPESLGHFQPFVYPTEGGGLHLIALSGGAGDRRRFSLLAQFGRTDDCRAIASA